MGDIPLYWAIRKDPFRAELQFKGACVDEDFFSDLMEYVVLVTEKAKKYSGLPDEDISPELLEEKFSEAPIQDEAGDVFVNPAMVVYFGINFDTFEQREKFLKLITTMAN